MTITQWLEHCQNGLVHENWDNVMLFTGPEGVGKSAAAIRLQRLLDPNFTPDRIAFTIPQFRRLIPKVPRYASAHMDEPDIEAVRAMYPETLWLRKYLKNCRGRNHHLSLCFPHDDLLNKAILNYRVRWNIHCPKRGHFIIRRRIRTETPTGPRWTWSPDSRPVVTQKWDLIKDDFWQTYLNMKEEHMMATAEEELDEPTSSIETGLDQRALTEYLRGLL